MKADSGFTLLELLISLTIITILAAISASALYQAFKTHERIKTESQKIESLQLSFLLMQRDFAQSCPRSIISSELHVFPIFIGTNQMVEFTRSGFLNPRALEKRSNLKRIAYLCQKNRLLRRSWLVLDSKDRALYEDRVLLSGLKSCQFSYLSHSLESLNVWHAAAFNKNSALMPKAVQLKFSLAGREESFLFPLTAQLYKETSSAGQ